MHYVVYIPLLISVLLGACARPLAGLLPPKLGTRLLVVAGTLCAASTAVSLAALASTYLGQLPVFAALGGWSVRVFRHEDPVPQVTAQLAAAAGVVIAIVFLVTLARQLVIMVDTYRLWHRLRPAAGMLVLVDQPEPVAYAVPTGRGGRIVMSTAMLRLLDARERSVLLAHETAHLRYHHWCYRAVATMVAALNPLLFALPSTVRYLTERWADEEAAAAVGDRTLVARTVARAALAAHRAPATTGAVAIGGGPVPRRVRSLLSPRPRLSRAGAAVLLAVSLVCVTAAAETGHDADGLFDTAATHSSAAQLS